MAGENLSMGETLEKLYRSENPFSDLPDGTIVKKNGMTFNKYTIHDPKSGLFSTKLEPVTQINEDDSCVLNGKPVTPGLERANNFYNNKKRCYCANRL